MKGQKPIKQFVITKSSDRERIPNIGGAWQTAAQEILSCRLTLPFDLKAGETLNFIAVPPNEPKAANENREQPANNSRPQPVRNSPPQRRANGQQPRGAA